MTSTLQRRDIKALAALAVAFALLLLLLTHVAGTHAPQILWLALVPVFLFAIIEIQSSQWLPAQANLPTQRHQPARPALFQRPPPSNLA